MPRVSSSPIRREELYKLREMPGEAEKLLQTILRAYTGLFTDYAYISETALSVYSGMPVPKVYELLTGAGQAAHHRLHSPQKDALHYLYARANGQAAPSPLAQRIRRP